METITQYALATSLKSAEDFAEVGWVPGRETLARVGLIVFDGGRVS